VGRTDIDVAVAQDAGLRDGGGGIGVQVALEFIPHLHADFDRRGIAVGNHADMDDVADGHAFQRNGRAILDPRGILKVGAEHQLARKQPAG